MSQVSPTILFAVSALGVTMGCTAPPPPPPSAPVAPSTITTRFVVTDMTRTKAGHL